MDLIVQELTENMVKINTAELKMFHANSKLIAKNRNALLNIMKTWIFTKAETKKEETEEKQTETKATTKKRKPSQKI